VVFFGLLLVYAVHCYLVKWFSFLNSYLSKKLLCCSLKFTNPEKAEADLKLFGPKFRV